MMSENKIFKSPLRLIVMMVIGLRLCSAKYNVIRIDRNNLICCRSMCGTFLEQ